MYFLALVAPDNINQQILKWKLWMKENYQCEVALKSPAHITMVPPFRMNQESEDDLIQSINEFSKTQTNFSIQLNGFSNFKTRVIFVDVVQNEKLSDLNNSLLHFLSTADKFPLIKDVMAFHPHIAIATRDLHKKLFFEAWKYFKEKKYNAEWNAESISLLRHNKRNWDVINTSQFKMI